jgi:hypothetical protein
MPKLSVELSEQDHRQLKIKSAWAGLTQSDVVRRLLSAWFSDEVQIPEDEPPTREKGDQPK